MFPGYGYVKYYFLIEFYEHYRAYIVFSLNCIFKFLQN